ncbi:hypothetical protein M1M86_00720 [Dehalococcoidales bacterium]|nr:hypothetical protein [Dehalococcoidales bacterium]
MIKVYADTSVFGGCFDKEYVILNDEARKLAHHYIEERVVRRIPCRCPAYSHSHG